MTASLNIEFFNITGSTHLVQIQLDRVSLTEKTY